MLEPPCLSNDEQRPIQRLSNFKGYMKVADKALQQTLRSKNNLRIKWGRRQQQKQQQQQQQVEEQDEDLPLSQLSQSSLK
jgi:NADPH-dependent ferric siderophore reductase